MSDRREGARFLRKKAEQLRTLANYSSFFSAPLLQVARELEERAHELEEAASVVPVRRISSDA
jgi:hypothetical protein